MVKQTLPQLESLAETVRTADTNGENTAVRIGELILALIASFPTDWSPSKPYTTGQWVIWYGRLVKCTNPTLAGQSPASHPQLWKDFVIDTLDKLVGVNLTELPVTQSALMAYVQQVLNGLQLDNTSVPVPSTEQQVNDGQDNTTFITPKLLALVAAQLSEAIDDVTTPAQNLQNVTDQGAITDKLIKTDGYKRPQKAFVNSFRGFSVYKADGNDETIEVVSVEAAKALLSGQSINYVGQITVNTCSQVAGSLYQSGNPSVAAKGRIYIDGAFVSIVTASAANAALAISLGFPVGTLLLWVFDVPANYQNNLYHSIELRHISDDTVLASVKSPGNCGIQTTPQPTFNIIRYIEEVAAQPGDNPPPVVLNPQPDYVVTGLNDDFVDLPLDEFYDPNGDNLTKETFLWTGSAEQALPSTISAYTLENGRVRVYFLSAIPVGTILYIRRKARDTSPTNPPAAYNFRVYFARTNTSAPYVQQTLPQGATLVLEGGDYGEWWLQETLSDNSIRPYTGPLTIYFELPYPNDMVLTPAATAGHHKARILANRLEKDVTLILHFDTPSGNYTYPVMGKDASSPALAQITKVAYAFHKNNPSAGEFSSTDIYVISDKPLQLAMNIANTGKSGYTSMNSGSYTGGYNRFLNVYGTYSTAGIVLYFKEVGGSVDVFTITIPPLPNSDKALTQIYPAP